MGAALLLMTTSMGLVWASESPARLTSARFEPLEVLLGEHFDLVMEVEVPEGGAVVFPDLSAGLAEGEIELLSEGEVDTLSHKEGRYALRKRYRLIGFEPSRYQLDSLGVLYASPEGGVDTLFAAMPLAVEVAMIPVDTTQTTIYDIKPPMKVPLYAGEVAGYLGLTLLALVVLAGMVVLILRLSRGGKATKETKPSEPPHVVAIRRLEQLHSQKLWQNDRLKEYYTILTDILREYIEGRYGVSALEMTSDEILAALKGVGIGAKHYADLARLLGESDLVKFAKYVPEREYHEESYYKVYYFVEESKELPAEELSNKSEEQK